MDKLKVNDFVEVNISYSLNTVCEFAKVTGDNNPIHIDPKFAETTVFKKPIVHGALVTSTFSKILASDLPGPGTIYLGQDTKFLAPVFHDTEITFKVQIIEIREDKGIYTLKTTALDKKQNTLLAEGKAVVKYNN